MIEIQDLIPSHHVLHTMTIRDYFAGQALAGNLAYSHCNPQTGNFQENCSCEGIALACYELADAMLKERSKEP